VVAHQRIGDRRHGDEKGFVGLALGRRSPTEALPRVREREPRDPHRYGFEVEGGCRKQGIDFDMTVAAFVALEHASFVLAPSGTRHQIAFELRLPKRRAWNLREAARPRAIREGGCRREPYLVTELFPDVRHRAKDRGLRLARRALDRRARRLRRGAAARTRRGDVTLASRAPILRKPL